MRRYYSTHCTVLPGEGGEGKGGGGEATELKVSVQC